MHSRELGFMSSWRMLTRDKGWVKPLLVLTVVSWIPIFGQIAVLGYGLEWARLTAWGVDAAPKQRDVDYGKVLATGGRAFLVVLSLGFVCGLVLQVLFPGSLAFIVSTTAGGGTLANSIALASGATLSILTLVATALLGTFLQAAAMRGTLYDSFSAGWRLDRLAQMVARDFGGFCRVLLISVIGSLISGAYAFIVAMGVAVIVMGGLLGTTVVIGLSDPYMNEWGFLVDQLLHMGAGPLLLFVLFLIALLFVGNVISIAMNLVSANAMGQWFCRFEVGSWGVSSAPLPDGVPHRAEWAAQTAAAPMEPLSAGRAAHATGEAGVADAARPTSAPDSPVCPDVAPGGTVCADDRPSAAMQDAAKPAGEIAVSPMGGGDVAPCGGVSASPLGEVRTHPSHAADAAPSKADEVACGQDNTAGAVDEAVTLDGRVELVKPVVAPLDAPGASEPEKKPIPLGPITTSDEEFDEGDGPFAK